VLDGGSHSIQQDGYWLQDGYLVEEAPDAVLDMPVYYLAVPAGSYGGTQQEVYQLAQPAPSQQHLARLPAAHLRSAPVLPDPGAAGLARRDWGPRGHAARGYTAVAEGAPNSWAGSLAPGLPHGQPLHPPGLVRPGYRVVPVLQPH
jgi:hypothetical protein